LFGSFNAAVKNAIKAFDAFNKRDKMFNIVLDDVERKRYESSIQELKDRCPEIMKRKNTGSECSTGLCQGRG